MNRIILATGGTGGHIFPALAVAEAVKHEYPDVDIVFMGGMYGPEADIITKAGYTFVGLPVKGVIGRGAKGVLAAFGMAHGVLKSVIFLHKYKPDCVLGFGGYAAFAGIFGARLLNIPTAVHEQNAILGKSNRLLAKVVKRVYMSFPVTKGVDAQKTTWVGNPVRQNISEFFASSSNKGQCVKGAGTQCIQAKKHLLVMGGSQGASAINTAIVSCAKELEKAGVCIWHQTGPTEYEKIHSAYQALGCEHVRVEAFITDMGKAYLWADAAFCRAGGSSIAELTLAGLPSILVPFPFAAHNHQWFNGKYVADQGGAILLEQATFQNNKESQEPLQSILRLFENTSAYEKMHQACLSIAKPKAAFTLARALHFKFSA